MAGAEENSYAIKWCTAQQCFTFPSRHTRLKDPLYGAKLTAKVARSAAVPGHELPITTGS